MVAGGLKNPWSHWSGRFATVLAIGAGWVECGDGAIPGSAAPVLVI